MNKDEAPSRDNVSKLGHGDPVTNNHPTTTPADSDQAARHYGNAGKDIEIQDLVAPPSTEARDAPAVPPPPDGGWNTWLQVLMSHLINFNAFGYTSSFGIFEAYYVEHLHYSASAVAWIGTVNLCLIYLVGIYSGRAMDAGHYRMCTALGLSLQLIGVFTTSVSTNYWQLMLSQGLCQGLGNGLLFCPAVANVATYFSAKKRALAVSWVACGGATGGLVWPAIAQSLLGRIGFGWTMRVMGFVMLFNAVLVVAFSRTRLPPKPSTPLFDWSAFGELTFALYCLGIFLVYWAVWIVYYFVRPFALDILGASQNTSFNMLLVLNGLGFPGRLIPALLSDRFLGPVNVLLISTVVASILLFSWIAVDSVGALYAWDAIYGFTAGSMQALTLASASSFTLDMSKVGSRVGLAFAVLSISSLTGPAIGGALISINSHSYLPAQLFAGVAMAAGSVILALARISRTGFRFKYRV